MVIDSLFQKRSQNLLIYLQMYPPPQDWKSWLEQLVMVSEIARFHVEDEHELNMNTIDSLAFMFSPIYLRLEGNVPPHQGLRC